MITIALLASVLALCAAPAGAKAKAKKTTVKRAAVKKTTAKPSAAGATKSTATTVAPKVAIPDHPVQGITKTSIKIGVITTAVSGVDMTDWYRALLRRWKLDGNVPINGRDVQFVYDLIDANDPINSNRAACVKQATKDKVALTIETSALPAGICLSKEFHVPVLGAAGAIPTDDDLAAAWPFLFYDNMSSSRLLRNWPYWAKDTGFLAAGSKIGTFIVDDPVLRNDFDKNFKPNLAKLGFKVSAEALYKDASSVTLAVQRFKSAGTDVVFFASMTAFNAFAQELDRQNYHPDVLLTDWDGGAITGAGVIRDLPDSFRATAMTVYDRARDGVSSNPPIPPNREACHQKMFEAAGRVLIPTVNGRATSDFSVAAIVEHICDQSDIVLQALRAAGPDLTTEALISGLELAKNVTNGQVGPITFSKTRHDGANGFATIFWDPSCDCFKRVSDFRPPWTD